jgi:hypothetical protein
VRAHLALLALLILAGCVGNTNVLPQTPARATLEKNLYVADAGRIGVYPLPLSANEQPSLSLGAPGITGLSSHGTLLATTDSSATVRIYNLPLVFGSAPTVTFRATNMPTGGGYAVKFGAEGFLWYPCTPNGNNAICVVMPPFSATSTGTPLVFLGPGLGPVTTSANATQITGIYIQQAGIINVYFYTGFNVQSLATAFNSGTDIAVDSRGALYVGTISAVQVFIAPLTSTASFNTGGNLTAQAVAVDSAGNLYAAGPAGANNTMQLVTYAAPLVQNESPAVTLTGLTNPLGLATGP